MEKSQAVQTRTVPSALEVKYETEKGEITLSPSTVKSYLVSGQGNVSDQELMMFMRLCQYQKLNPFLREAYLIKYSDKDPATIVVGKEVFTQRAAKDPECDGYESGVIIQKTTGEIEYRKGSFFLKTETLVGGWAKVYRKNWKQPIEKSVRFEEYARYNAQGQLTRNWKNMPGTMIAKVALVQALREAMPDRLSGLYDADEMHDDRTELEEKPVEIETKDETPKKESQKKAPTPKVESPKTDTAPKTEQAPKKANKIDMGKDAPKFSEAQLLVKGNIRKLITEKKITAEEAENIMLTNFGTTQTAELTDDNCPKFLEIIKNTLEMQTAATPDAPEMFK